MRSEAVQRLSDSLVLGQLTNESEQRLEAEIAAGALLCGDYEDAQAYAYRVIAKSQNLSRFLTRAEKSAYQTLTWASVRYGKTTEKYEERIWEVLVNSLISKI